VKEFVPARGRHFVERQKLRLHFVRKEAVDAVVGGSLNRSMPALPGIYHVCRCQGTPIVKAVYGPVDLDHMLLGNSDSKLPELLRCNLGLLYRYGCPFQGGREKYAVLLASRLLCCAGVEE